MRSECQNRLICEQAGSCLRLNKMNPDLGRLPPHDFAASFEIVGFDNEFEFVGYVEHAFNLKQRALLRDVSDNRIDTATAAEYDLAGLEYPPAFRRTTILHTRQHRLKFL
jgi:hypothetical protein